MQASTAMPAMGAVMLAVGAVLARTVTETRAQPVTVGSTVSVAQTEMTWVPTVTRASVTLAPKPSWPCRSLDQR